MLDGLFGSKFTNKCKHSVKYIRARLDPIRKKKEAVVWYLKRDVAELVSHGHDLNAFSRMETLIIEMNQESCYNMIEQYCEDILNQLKVIEKQRECPDEAKEAIATLIFAAARFPDLRELCEFRQIFTQKYGGQLEQFVNSEFMKNTQERTFSDERKIKVMQNIAQEFSIGFDAKALKWKLNNPTQAKYDEPNKPIAARQESKLIPEIRAQPKDLRPKPNDEPKELRPKQKEPHAEPKELRPKQKELHAEPKELWPKHKELRPKYKEAQIDSKVIWDEPLELRPKPRELRPKPKEVQTEPQVIWDEPKESRYKPKELLYKPKELHDEPKESNKELKMEPKDIHVIPKKTRDHRAKETPYSFNEEKPGLSSVKSLAEKEHSNNIGPVLDRLQVKDNGSGFDFPRPESKGKDNGSGFDFPRPDSKGKASKMQMIPPPYTKPNTPRAGKYTEEEINDSDPYLAQKQHIRPVKEDRPVRADNLPSPYVKPEKPRPVSVRSRVPKPEIKSETDLYDEELMARSQSIKKKHTHYDNNNKYDDVNYAKEFGKPSKSRHREYNNNEQDEEDNSIDYGNLLRGPSRGHRHKYDEEKVMDKLLIHYSRKGLNEGVQPIKERSRGKRSTADQVHGGPERAVSLPVDPDREEESVRVTVRAVSMQPDPFSNNGARVHPNLPDFDELAARVKALRKA